MKRTILAIFLSFATTLIATNTMAQYYGGAVLDHDIMMPIDFAQLSKNQIFGTSRSMAMGGAFTSLGGDISSATVNPAGLGMLTNSVFSITPMVSSTNATTTNQPSWVGNNNTSMSFANMGATFNLYENGSGSLISINGAITYTRLADYNSKMSFSSISNFYPQTGELVPSIVDVFIGQLEGASIYPSSSGAMDYADNPYYWSAQAAYQAYLIDPSADLDRWGTETIGYNSSTISSFELSQSGRADEYSFALGGNIGNVIYFGATIGLQEILQKSEYIYQEEYDYSSYNGYAYASADDQDPLARQAGYSNLWQKTTLSGSGANFKVGLTARPSRALRIGVAFHSPTYYSLARTYQTSMETTILSNEDEDDVRYTATSPEMIDNYEYSWDFRTPAKLLTGASLQVGSFGIISFDYERQWYNWIRVSNAPGELTPYDYQCSFEDYYKPTNTFRLGVEVKPVPTVALRVGGGTSSSMIKNESAFYSSPAATSSNYITCGVGFQVTPFTSLDFAYQYHHQDYTSYRLFYVENSDGIVTGSDLFNTSYNSNYITATLTFRL